MAVSSSLDKIITVSINYPLTIKKEQKITEIENFNYNLNFDFEHVYKILSDFAAEHQKNPDYVPVGYLSLTAYENNFTFDLVYKENNSVLYSFIFDNFLEKNQSLVFNFASKYIWLELNKTGNPIDIKPIPPQTAHPGYEFSYKVNATGENVKFSDYTDFFDISEDGLISFTPTREDAGNHSIMIKAYDDKGNSDLETFELNIVLENNAPELEDIEDQEVNIGETFSYDVNASDQDGDIIYYLVETSLDNLTINPISGEINFSAKPEDEGDYTITVIVIDAKGGLVEKYFDLTVKND